MNDWYRIDNVSEVDSPALVIYPDRVKENIEILKRILPDTNRLRPHVKTHKSGEVSALMLKAGITKFKCATIAEAEMLALAGAPDVLLAYPVVGPKALRLLSLAENFPKTVFSCLIDTLQTAKHLSEIFEKKNRVLPVYLDINCGMNRTGIIPEQAYDLYLACKDLKGLRIEGIHAYDGHIRDADLQLRTEHSDESYLKVEALALKIRQHDTAPLTVIAGGTPTFPIHAKRQTVECSPGTFVYWDYGYQQLLAEQPYLFAALVITRVISKPAPDTLCLDLGHKSIASENPLDRRVHFLNASDLQPVGHSEEHLVVKTSKANEYQVGDVFYGVPFHICPTCALYEHATVVENHKADQRWTVLSRNRTITV
jgi:D-threonine aldolase